MIISYNTYNVKGQNGKDTIMVNGMTVKHSLTSFNNYNAVNTSHRPVI